MSVPWLLLLSVAAGGLLLGAWGDHGLSELPPVPDPGPCTPPADSSAPVGLRGYRRYFANDSLIGRPVPCTRDDKICFRHNLVFNVKGGLCDHIGGGHHTCDLRPNRTEFEHGSGRIIGVCQTFEDPCPGYRMAYDGRCHRKELVRDVICGCGAKPTRHFLEGVECRSSPATPITIQQPEDEGRCLIPDLRFPDIERSQFFENPYSKYQGFLGSRTAISFRDSTPSLKCNHEQASCFAQEKVWVKGYAGCYTLLEQSPCAEDHVVVLDLQAATQGRAEGTCAHVRGGCPSGYKRMVFDGKCHEDSELRIEAPGRVVWNQYGNKVVIPRGFAVTFHPTKVNDTCLVLLRGVAPGFLSTISKPPCGPSNEDKCDLYEVEADPPNPDI